MKIFLLTFSAEQTPEEIKQQNDGKTRGKEKAALACAVAASSRPGFVPRVPGSGSVLTQGPEEPNTLGVLLHRQQGPRRVCPEIQRLLSMLFRTASVVTQTLPYKILPSACFCNVLLKSSLTYLELARPEHQSGMNELQIGNRFSFLKQLTVTHRTAGLYSTVTWRGWQGPQSRVKSAVLTWVPLCGCVGACSSTGAAQSPPSLAANYNMPFFFFATAGWPSKRGNGERPQELCFPNPIGLRM